MSLADELLADLEEMGGDEAPDEALQAELLQSTEIEEIDEITDESSIGQSAEGLYNRVTHVARLRASERFTSIMNGIDANIARSMGKEELCGPVEAAPEYKLIFDANNLAVDIDHEMNVIHKFVRDKYAKRFPELESLVPSAMEYINSVKELGNDILEKAKNNEVLQNILLPATVIVVSVTASTTQGERLSPEELTVISEACDMGIDLNAAKLKIFEYVEGRMSFIAPNLTAVLGSNAAAKIMGVAGGLGQLAKMPACNILVLGAQKRTLAGFSATAILPHTGFIYYTHLVQSIPPDLRRKAARLIAGKCALAARIDAIHADPEAVQGRRLLEEIEGKIERMVEPPPVKLSKALPKPIDAPSKKRGGRRVRKMKERMGITDMRKKSQRMNFGELEEDVLQDDLGFTLGQLKTSGGGRIRTPQVDDKTRARLSKTLQRNLQKQSTHGGTTSIKKHGGHLTSGTASSVTFTPVQGLEIVNPQAKESQSDGTKTNYFSSTASFVKVNTPISLRK